MANKQIMIAPRRAGKTTACIEKATQTGATYIGQYCWGVTRANLNRMSKDFGLDSDKQIRGIDSDLSGIEFLVVDEMEYVLQRLLETCRNFTGTIIFSTLTKGDGNEIIEVEK